MANFDIDGDINFKETTYYMDANGDMENEDVKGNGDANLSQQALQEIHTEMPSEPILSSDRGAWGAKTEFIFSCLSYAVGLGNVWRFPYLCYVNGGGAFLFPYVIMLFLVGMPLLYLESALGQYGGSGPVTIWKISPIFGGLGWAMILTTAAASVYYCMLIAWTLFYFFISFRADVPWRDCNPPWATENCVSIERQIIVNNCTQHSGFYSMAEETCLTSSFLESPGLLANGPMNITSYNDTFGPFITNLTSDFHSYLVDNFTQSYDNKTISYLFSWNLKSANLTKPLAHFLNSSVDPKSPSDEFFHNYVLSISDGFSDLGAPKWQLALCLLLAWSIVAIALCRGIKSAGKAVYFTALFPYLVLFILLVRSLFLEGSSKGLIYYFKPQWNRLLEPKIWGDAAVQIFYSLSPCWGGIIALSSYNKFNNNALLDTVVVVVGDGLTSIFAGMVIFAVLGYMSTVMNMPVEEVVKQGTGLAFIVYPDIVTTMPIAPLWSILFFSMLLTLGFGTMFANVNCIYTGIVDRWPAIFRKNKIRSFSLLCSICLSMFLVGLSCTTRGGIYVLTLLDNYSASYSVLIIAFLELFVIGWVYGIDRFLDNIEEMEKKRPPLVVKLFWKYITPVILLFVTVFKVIKASRSEYGPNVFPIAADLVGGLLSFCIVLPIPIIAINLYTRGKLARRLRQSSGLPWYLVLVELAKPHPHWGPRMGDKDASLLNARATGSHSIFESQKTLLHSQSTIASSSMNMIQQHRVA